MNALSDDQPNASNHHRDTVALRYKKWKEVSLFGVPTTDRPTCVRSHVDLESAVAAEDLETETTSVLEDRRRTVFTSSNLSDIVWWWPHHRHIRRLACTSINQSPLLPPSPHVQRQEQLSQISMHRLLRIVSIMTALLIFYWCCVSSPMAIQ